MATTFESPQVQNNRCNGSSEDSVTEQLAQAQRDLHDVIGALSLLGIKRCTQCKQFFSSADPGALFGNGTLVCFSCVPDWWQSHAAELEVGEREKLETRLSSWLRKYHGAQIVKEESAKAAPLDPLQYEIPVHCSECGGSGKLLQGERCRFCNGHGKVRIVGCR